MPYIKTLVCPEEVWSDGVEQYWIWNPVSSEVVLSTDCCGLVTDGRDLCPLCVLVLEDIRHDLLIPPKKDELYGEYQYLDDIEAWEVRQYYDGLNVDYKMLKEPPYEDDDDYVWDYDCEEDEY